jgi:hypothetical protein
MKGAVELLGLLPFAPVEKASGRASTQELLSIVLSQLASDSANRQAKDQVLDHLASLQKQQQQQQQQQEQKRQHSYLGEQKQAAMMEGEGVVQMQRLHAKVRA